MQKTYHYQLTMTSNVCMILIEQFIRFIRKYLCFKCILCSDL